MRPFDVMRRAFLLLLPISAGLAQQGGDTLADVFPLSPGNQWTYRYFAEKGSYPAGTPYEMITDSGQASYRVLGDTIAGDSTRWQFQVRRNLIHHLMYWPTAQDTSFPVSDTTSFELIERSAGQHQLYRLEDPAAIRMDVFPFTSGFNDTSMIFRYRRVGAGDTTVFQSCTSAPQSPAFRSTFSFKKDVGLIRTLYNTGTVDVWSSTEHYLLNSTITSVAPLPGSLAAAIQLYQNYPNPFNPATTIRYALPQRARVSLAVYNTLGQLVSTVVDAEEEPGFHEVRFDATGLASGVYYCRLRAGATAKTMELLLLR